MPQTDHIQTPEQPPAPAPARGSNQSGLRAHNERLVLTLIRQRGPLPKAEIARVTGLSAQTVSVIMRALEAEGLLQRGAKLRGKVGQPSVPMALNPDGAYFLGLRVGRRSSELVMTDFIGRVTHRCRLRRADPTPDDIVRFADVTIGQVLNQMPEERRARVAGLGIALPYRLWDWGAGEPADWRDRDIGAEIGAARDLPVYLCNDASAACGAELVFGTATGARSFLYVFVGHFVGGGLVIDNALFTGDSGNAAALGSMPVVATDGQLRQLVEVASLATLDAMLAARGWTGAAHRDWPEQWELPTEVVDRWLDEAAQGLAQALLAAACVVDVGHVLIDGWLPEELRDSLVARVGRAVGQRAGPGIEAPQIGAGSIGPQARSLGAASLPLSDRFLVDRNLFSGG